MAGTWVVVAAVTVETEETDGVTGEGHMAEV